jgi:uncharacterized protein DUF4258
MLLPRRRGRLIYSGDAQIDMRDRGISHADVKNALRNQLGERPGRSRYLTTVVIVGTAMNGKPLCVSVEEEDRNRIVSLFWQRG